MTQRKQWGDANGLWGIGLLAALAALPALTACGAREDASSTKIVGGRLVIDADPVAKSTVSMMDATGRSFCTGSLIDSQTVLTASHCLEGYPAGRPMYVGFGLVARETAAENTVRVARRVMHEGYDTAAMEDEIPTAAPNDIGLLVLAAPAPAGYVPVPMLTTATDLMIGETLTLAGFGLTDATFGTSGTLRSVDVKLTALYDDAQEIEFGQSPGRSACMGDSGGPAFVERGGSLALVGVTSRGTPTCDDKGLYTDIRYFADWIAANSAAAL